MDEEQLPRLVVMLRDSDDNLVTKWDVPLDDEAGEFLVHIGDEAPQILEDYVTR